MACYKLGLGEFIITNEQNNVCPNFGSHEQLFLMCYVVFYVQGWYKLNFGKNNYPQQFNHV